MTRKRLIEDIRQDPPRFYRAPADVLRDRRFADPERREILQAWRGLAPAALTADIDAALREIDARGLHAAE